MCESYQLLNSFYFTFRKSNRKNWEKSQTKRSNVTEICDYRNQPGVLLGRIFVSLTREGPEATLQNFKLETDERLRLTGTAIANFALGRKVESDRALNEFISKYQKKNASEIAQLYSLRDEKDEAFKWLEQAFIQKESGVTGLLAFPTYKNLRSDPRFTQLLKRMRFRNMIP